MTVGPGVPSRDADSLPVYRQAGRSDGDRVAIAIEAVLRIVEDETAAIRAYGVREVEKYSDRKGQALMSLTKILGTGQSSLRHPATAAALHALRAALMANQYLLKVHIDAVTEVSQIIVRCVQNSDFDGTYSKPQLPYGQL